MRRKSPVEKIKRQYSLKPELVKLIQLEAVYIGCFDSSVVEKALELYFDQNKVERNQAMLTFH